MLEYNVSVIGESNVSCRVSLIDKDDYYAAFNVDHTVNFTGILKIVSPKLWWPYLMNPEPGYLYTFQVRIDNFMCIGLLRICILNNGSKCSTVFTGKIKYMIR